MATKLTQRGDWKKTKDFFKKALNSGNVKVSLEKYGKLGVEQLRNYTPKRTGLTAASWRYEIEHKNGRYIINFLNDNVNKGVNIAVIIQYGHGTRTGGYVQGVDYINPALNPVFEKLADDAWREVVS